MTLEDVEKDISKLIDTRNNMKRIESIETDDVNFIVFKKYLELENVQKVANYLNDNNFRKINNETGNRIKYVSNDISKIIRTKNSINDEWLYKFVNKLFKEKKDISNNRYN